MLIYKCTESGGDNTYVCQSLKIERFLAKAAGFKYCPYEKLWKTTKAYNAAKLRQFADHTCQEELSTIILRQKSLVAIDSAFLQMNEFENVVSEMVIAALFKYELYSSLSSLSRSLNKGYSGIGMMGIL